MDPIPRLAFGEGSGLMSSLFAPKAPKLPNAASPDEVAARSINLRRYETLPRYMETRRDFDAQKLGLDLAQTNRAFAGQNSLIENQINPSIQRQRSQFFNRDVADFNNVLQNQGQSFRTGLLALSPELANAQKGIDEDTAILNELRRQAQRDLQLGQSLSPEESRDIEQATGSYAGRLGRGAGAFSVGQLALNRDAAKRQREMQRRSFAGDVYGMGGESQRRNLLQSQQFTSPFLNMLGQTQARAAQIVGTPMEQWMAANQFAQYGTPDVPQGIDPSVLQLESLRLGQGLGQAQLKADASNQRFGALMGGVGGGLGLAGSIYSANAMRTPPISPGLPSYLQNSGTIGF